MSLYNQWHPIERTFEQLRRQVAHEALRRDAMIENLARVILDWSKVVPSGTDVKAAFRMVNDAEDLIGTQIEERTP